MSSFADPRLDDLRSAAAAAADGKGHALGPWEPDANAEQEAATATCRRCGRIVHVRVGRGMTGIAGAAITDDCRD